MSEKRVKCVTCENMILQSTANNNLGHCGVCKRDIEHLVHNMEIGRFEEEWSNFIKFSKMTNIDKEYITSIVNGLTDKNLIEQLNKPDIKDKYYFLETPEYYKQNLIGEYDRESTNNVYDLMGCSSLPNDWICPDIRFTCTYNHIPSIPILAAPFIIVRKSLIEKIKGLIDSSVQLLPVNVTAKGKSYDEFLVINILKEYSVWDLNISTWEGAEWDKTHPFRMRNMMVKNNLNIEDSIFRNKDYKGCIVVSKQLGEILRNESDTSIVLKSMNKWSN